MKTTAYQKAHCNMCAPADDKLPGILCDPCFEIACDIAESNRRKFQKLLSAGVSRRMANEIMIRRIDGELPS